MEQSNKRKLMALLRMSPGHRIKDDRIENSITGIVIWRYVFAASIILCSTPT